MLNHFRRTLYLLAAAATFAHAGSYEDFFVAITRDNPGSITSLLQRGFDPNSTDPKGRPALGLALHQKSYRAAAALFEHPGIDVNALNASGESALMLAAITGEQVWVERLLARGAVVNQPGWAALHYAASGPNPAIVELLLARGAAVNALSPNGTTPLMMAAGYGSESAIPTAARPRCRCATSKRARPGGSGFRPPGRAGSTGRAAGDAVTLRLCARQSRNVGFLLTRRIGRC